MMNEMPIFVAMNGEPFLGGYFGGVDEHGHRVERSKAEYPYSYDAFVTWRGLANEELNGSVYSDRLYQWDWEKHNALCNKHFGNQGQRWSERQPDKIEAFLRDYLDDPELVLGLVMEGCNVSSGYPYWYFGYKSSKKSEA